jgi:hypothetical protein
MNNLKLAVKLGFGFGALILIAAILGGVAIVSMKGVEGDSTRLAREYVPEVGMANSIERHTLLMMYAVRAYSYSGNKNYLEERARSRPNWRSIWPRPRPTRTRSPSWSSSRRARSRPRMPPPSTRPSWPKQPGSTRAWPPTART